MYINWFPGHMTKSMRMMEENIKLVDAVIYVLDARAPQSCINPNFNRFISSLPVVFVLNKADLADESAILAWKKALTKENREVVAVNSTASKNSAVVISCVKRLCAAKINKFKSKGVRATVRVMIMGVPNTGKSTLTNNLCGKAKAITGNRAGVTRGKQWVKVSDTIEVLDTPGTLYPKIDDETIGLHLAYIASIKDEVVDTNELACNFVKEMKEKFNDLLVKRYGVELDGEPLDIIERIGRKRGFVQKGSVVDIDRAAEAILDDFRKGRLGKITLEKAEDYVGA